MPEEKSLWQPTPGPSGTQWSEDLFHSKQQAFPFPILALEVNELNLPPFVEPSQHNEPPVCTPTQPILGLSEVPQTGNNSTHDPEPEVALTQSMDYPFDKSNF
ncbi:hypothetical protein O181_016923 [Austropuccinia psidii MF-1]|uniref:Uncharacterized protein n=1 Tax=Austropuccinia psidii MF-1 TaxID=1389203 RepID=A0A9Q3C661_9BASI|nr:hypothetical protein [Austropuccinia psidii MF-1]